MNKRMPRFVKPLLILVPCVILALIVIIGCFDIVPAGYKGVKLTMGAVNNTVLNEGIHFKLPFAQRIVHVDARVKKYTVEGFKADGNGVSMETIVLAHEGVTPA